MPAKILIVEDEMLVAMELSRSLPTAGSTRSALLPTSAPPRGFVDQSIDLALVDLNLRDGLTGPEIGRMLGDKGVTVCS